MIEVKLYKNDEGNYYRYEAEGHAGYAEHGKDIVCAAVSAIAQSVLFTLEKICINISSRYDKERNLLYASAPFYEIAKKEVQAVFSLLELGIKSIEEAFPENVQLKIIERNEVFELINIDIKDNITITDDNNDVIAVIAEKEIILADGYKAYYDVGVEEG